MEAMNGWLSFPMYESFNHDLAIRRFCPARMEQEQGSGEWEETVMNEFELLSPSDDATSTPHDLAASEVDELVDSFINVDHQDNGHDDHHQSPDDLEYQDHFDHFQHDEMVETFSMLNDIFVDVPMMIGGGDLEMSTGSIENSAAVGPGMVPSMEEVSYGVDRGLHLVHLLLACAEAVGCRDTQLANSVLAQIWASVNPFGDSLQRVSYCFALGLRSRLSLLQNATSNGTFANAAIEVSLITREEKMEAFQLLYQTTPYVAFGFMAANEAICEAARGKDALHVIDLGMDHTLQWPSFIRTLASRPEGPPKVRITGLINDHQNLLELEASMKVLAEDASSLGVSLEFNMILESVTPSLLTRENLNLRDGEALFFNSIMHLHKFVKESRGSLKAILQAIKRLSPTLLTVVEQDANHNGPFFLGRFLESLHYYSAIFDSLEASLLPRNSRQRMKIEKLHFAEEIRNIVAYEGCDRIERHERADQWRRQLGRAGFQVMGLKCMSQARMMLSVYGCDGYTLASDKGCLLLGWKGRPIMLASAWKAHNVPSS
ncbi:DELLA protein GAI1, putative [Ricinus communis]|uniref:DELLA protein GAI1, putative n=1 Tax=Ricinus communis TaxID=3988 RepID=B9RHZ2_RICCO|nr:DELLA protein GAI1, putative [Ricinus communis]|eukprot:XP_002513361.1 DELLA protein RGL1 [Ricinus communis]